MASSEHHRPQRPLPLARHNSSFLGTIKNIVTAPLTWFAQDQPDDASSGKRRRPVEQAATEPLVMMPVVEEEGNGGEREEKDEAERRSKRMRRSPPPALRTTTTQHYLDPPAASLRRTHSTRRPSVVPRASSAVLPSTRTSRATLSPRRHPPGVQRTMSIDPPYLTSPSRRDIPSSASGSFNFGSDMDMVVDTARDVSMPPSPLSPRPSFRMRSSMTPQPQHVPARHISEPPPLNSLISKPVFLHQPTQSHQERAQTPTLGSLVESTRATRSPSRQHHSSLLFSSNASTATNENKDAPAQRALQQLDVYKTPLLPTRMRSSNLPNSITGKTTPDMFKSRRSSRLVLMPEDRDRVGRKVSGSSKSPLVNETKPYAGEGGMKKLLARHKLDAEKEVESKGKEGGESSEENTPYPTEPSPPPAASIALPPPPPAGSDWFSTAGPSSSSTSGSSLRVGRTKTSRNHIQRPAKTRFSAVYEEEADDAMDGEDEDRRKERQMLEEAAKKVPVFQIPAGFSFAKDTAAPVPPVTTTEKEKEPPIKSLPFSFAKPAPSASATTTATEPAKSDSISKPAAPSIFGRSTLAPPAAPARVPTPEVKAPAPVPAAPAPPSFFNLEPPKPATPVALPPPGSSIPNFFSNSPALKATPPLPSPPTLNFGATTSSTSSSSSDPPPFSFGQSPATATPAKPVKDSDNPFWVGETKAAAEQAKPATSLFGGATSAFPPLSKPASETAAPAPAPFSFSKPAEAKPAEASSAASGLPFSFGGAPAETKKVETESAVPKPLFGATNNSSSLFGFGEAPRPSSSSSLFGEPPKVAAPPQSTPSPLPFTFGAPAGSAPAAPPAEAPKPFNFGSPSTSSPTVEAPKPLFGGGGFSFGAEKQKEAKPASPAPFAFGQPAAAEKDKEVKPSTPFSFGAAPSTPPAVPSEPKSMFNFAQPAPAAPTSIGFSFSGGGSAGADVSNKQPFMFGQPSSLAPTARPITPPKNNDNEFRMEESPTREMQQMNGNGNGKQSESRPSLVAAPFSFGPSTSGSNGAPGSLFGGGQSSAPAAAPFSFGPSSSNPFAAKESKPEEPKGFGGFGQSAPQAPQITTSFSFGQQKDDQRPASAGAFSFGTTPTSASNPAPFSFGGSNNPNPFGQPANGSAPSSPSTFNQPSPFAFGAPAPAASSFGFGSQPNSPAAGAPLTLPQSAMTGFGGNSGFGQTASPSSPFSGPIPLAPSTSGGGGGSLFTIGSAPAPSAGGGPRQIKKLPRRGGLKR